MGQDPRDTEQGLDDRGQRTPEQVRDEIEQTRAELGDTVAALAEKTDVKAQAKRVVQDTKATVTGKASEIGADVKAKKDEFTSSAQQATPDSVSEAGAQLAGFAQRNRAVLIAVAALGLGLLIGRRSAR